MARPRRVTSIALSTLAVIGGLAVALPPTASATVATPHATPLTSNSINLMGAVNATGVFTGTMYVVADGLGANTKSTVDYGDGTPALQQTGGAVPTADAPMVLNHQYANHGRYKLTVTVDGGSGQAPVSHSWNVVWHYATAPTDPALTVDKAAGNAPLTVTAKISGGTVDPDAPKSYVVTWGDDSPVETIAAPASGPLVLTHVYTELFENHLTVHTSDGVDVSYNSLGNPTNSVTVLTYGLTLDTAPGSPGQVVLNLNGGGPDLGSGKLYTYFIDWGDGGKVEAFYQSQGYYARHSYAKTGTYTISVKMADGSDPDNPSLPQYHATTTVTVTSTPGQTHPGGLVVSRVWGMNRYDTSIGVSYTWAAGSADAVVLATGVAAPDALAGVPFAAHVNGPLLLTNPATLLPEVRDEIDRVTGGPATKKTVYILGGTSAVPQAQEDALRHAGYTVVRLGGATRFDTALKIAGQFGPTKHVIVATGLNFPDALAAGPLGAAENAPIVLTSDTTTDPATAAFIRQHAGIDPVGVQAQKAVTALKPTGQTVDRTLAGSDRYATATAVAARFAAVVGHAPSAVGLASGVAFPDALTGGAYAAKVGMPLVLTEPRALTPATAAYLTDLRQAKALQSVEIFGGSAAISNAIEARLKDM